jgi:rod shape-determining protein MreC
LLFVVIEGFALRYFSHSSSFNQAKAVNVSNFLVGDIYTGIQSVKHYFSLARENRQLNEQVASLLEELEQRQTRVDTGTLTASGEAGLGAEIPYIYTTARVSNNSITGSQNLITLNKGMRDGVRTEMAVVSDGAIVGYIVNCSERFSVAVSVLNTRFRTSGRIEGQDYFGSIYWDGLRADEVVLSEIPKYAPIAVGDTIVTTDYSSYFPPGLLIGKVVSFELINNTYYDARVKLSANMAALNHVLLVDYVDRDEKLDLEQETAAQENY